ncbi:hypothetical protein JO04_19570 [Salmonella enterica subsp. enterica serovar Give]|uniref:Uncharacterized protein n=1 Tax=Salmonella enterica subsp. enterica serovar Give TaxID=46626 RepID=A0A8E7NBF1_SALET|nr:hypothetical protein [Salmonella enterica]EBW2289655.1 hypothetical protein [Salmonella enterica subsp. enterica serovar Newport]EDU9351079.1 hypothetical protein [Salmonella enterica subsp. enterica]EEP8237637.1 hypothetical protein [Salmonella enterica subsp. enterica serovar Chester]EAA9231822.1 hypothetical protein [Salmonella enterica]EAM8390359.1 hypothetical protein [Salmonella enterica]
METYPNPDDIRENTADILSALSVDNIPERYGFTAELASLKNCISEDEYCNMEFYETGYAFLKALLRTRLRLKRTDPAHPLLPLISSSVEALRTQLKENEAYARLLIGMDAVSRWGGVMNVSLLGLTATMILTLGGAVLAHVWF